MFLGLYHLCLGVGHVKTMKTVIYLSIFFYIYKIFKIISNEIQRVAMRGAILLLKFSCQDDTISTFLAQV